MASEIIFRISDAHRSFQHKYFAALAKTKINEDYIEFETSMTD